MPKHTQTKPAPTEAEWRAAMATLNGYRRGEPGISSKDAQAAVRTIDAAVSALKRPAPSAK